MTTPNSAIDRKTPLIAVLGPAGLSGGYLLGALKKANVRTRAVAHSDAGVQRAMSGGADETVKAELADPQSVCAAIEGVDAIYMIPPSMHPHEDDFAITVVRAAEDVGVKRFVYTSVLHPHTPALRHHMRKARAEAAIRDSSLNWTILQPSMYAQMVFLIFGNGPAGQVRVPFDTSLTFSVIDLRELSAVAVKVLTETGHEFASYELCGPGLTMGEMVRIAGRIRGVELEPTRIAPSLAALPAKVSDRPSEASDMRAMWEDYDHHGLRGNTNVLEMLLGRPPAGFEDVARSMVK
jgi:uncharacterized protein YbjT (DUF2867 family)